MNTPPSLPLGLFSASMSMAAMLTLNSKSAFRNSTHNFYTTKYATSSDNRRETRTDLTEGPRLMTRLIKKMLWKEQVLQNKLFECPIALDIGCGRMMDRISFRGIRKTDLGNVRWVGVDPGLEKENVRKTITNEFQDPVEMVQQGFLAEGLDLKLCSIAKNKARCKHSLYPFIQAMFSLHHLLDETHTMTHVVERIGALLAPGGDFLAIVPDGEIIYARLCEAREKTPAEEKTIKYGNEYFLISIDRTELDQYPNAKYHIRIGDPLDPVKRPIYHFEPFFRVSEFLREQNDHFTLANSAYTESMYDLAMRVYENKTRYRDLEENAETIINSFFQRGVDGEKHKGAHEYFKLLTVIHLKRWIESTKKA